jgi:hypothetical protein
MNFKWYGPQILAQIETQLNKNLVECGQDLQQKSANQAPKDIGDLRGNCAVNANNLEIEVGYNLPYAVKQHEELGYKHTDGKAKYLEDPYNASKEKYVNYCGKGLIK